MKGGSQPFQLQKKLIIHFDVHNVLKINSNSKQLFVYDLCSNWIWGKLQKNNKQDPQKVTAWKISSPSLSLEQPEPQTVTYKQYLLNYLKPTQQESQKLILGLSKGAGAKAKAEIQKNIKNITLPKTLYQTLKEVKQLQNQNLNKLLQKYSNSAKYQILPAFYKYILWLKKNKRQFAIVIHNQNPKDNHAEIINELNLFFSGDHPLYNGKNGTPLVKLDGSKSCKNFVIEQTNICAVYKFGEKDFFQTYGTLNYSSQKDVQLFKQSFKSLKQIKLCENASEIYSHNHSILALSACIYQINPINTVFIDPIDYHTQQIYFTSSDSPLIYSCLNQVVSKTQSFTIKVNLFQYLKDVDFFVKSTQNIQKIRLQEIQKAQKKQNEVDVQNEKIQSQRKIQQNDGNYLKRTILPVLQSAIRQVDLFRPQDPLGFIALYCLKNKDKIKSN